MSKTLDRERLFDSNRRGRVVTQSVAPAQPPLEPQTSKQESAVAVAEEPVPVSPAAVSAVQEPPVEIQSWVDPLPAPPPLNQTVSRRVRPIWVLLLIATVVTYRFQSPAVSFDLHLPKRFIPGFLVLERSVASPKSTLTTHLVPPTMRFLSTTPLDEPAKPASEGSAILPMTLRPLSVSAPLNLVSTQTFVQLETDGAPAPASLPEQALEPVPTPKTEEEPAAAIPAPVFHPVLKTSKPGADPVARTLQLMDAAVADAARVASGASNSASIESKKPDD